MLAASCFLLWLSQQQWQDGYISDNQGLINRITDQHKDQHSYPNATLVPDRDLVKEIYATNRTLNATATFRHFPGHQDALKKFVALPLDAQLNVEAGKEVGYYQSMYGMIVRQKILPSAPVQLHLGLKPLLDMTTQLPFTSPPPNQPYMTTLHSVTIGMTPSWTPSPCPRSRTASREIAMVVKLIHGLPPPNTNTNTNSKTTTAQNNAASATTEKIPGPMLFGALSCLENNGEEPNYTLLFEQSAPNIPTAKHWCPFYLMVSTHG
jgi:hypothetical protein